MTDKGIGHGANVMVSDAQQPKAGRDGSNALNPFKKDDGMECLICIRELASLGHGVMGYRTLYIEP